MKRNNISTIEITERHVKWIQFAGGKIVQYKIIDIPEASDEAVVQVLTQFNLSKKNKPDQLIVVIPRRYLTLRHLNLPSHADDEIRKMIDLQIAPQIPYSKEEVFLDSLIVEKTPVGFTKVLVIIIHKDVVNRYLKIFRSLGLMPSALVFSSEGIVFWHYDQHKKERQKETDPVMLINIDLEHSEICFAHQDKLLFSRSINLGSRDLKDEGLTSFIKQVDLSLRAYITENIAGHPVRAVILSDMKEAQDLGAKIKEQHQLSVEIENPCQSVSLRDLPETPSLGYPGVSLTVGLAFSLTEHHRFINLLPYEYRESRKKQQIVREWFKVSFLVVLCYFLGISALRMNLIKSSMLHEKIEGQVESLKPDVAKAEFKLKRFEFFKGYIESRLIVADIIDQLFAMTPSDISFTNFELNEKRVISVQGTAATGSSVNAFQASILNSSQFMDVNLQYATKRKTIMGELTNFQITFKQKQSH